ncbi:hypothetical protein CHUAL_001192 [Chamberlinius hualienensis]
MPCCSKCPNFSLTTTLIYCSGCYGNLVNFIGLNPPSHLTDDEKHGLAVVNKSLTIRQFRKKLKKKKIDPKTSEVIRENLDTLTTYSLLSYARREGIVNGYWRIICDDDQTLNKYWRDLVLSFYSSKLDYEFLCCNRKPNGGGSINIVSSDFRDVKLIGEVAILVREVAISSGFNPEKKFRYKPVFFEDVGITSAMNANKQFKSTIFSSSFDPNGICVKYETGVLHWLLYG